MLRLSLIIILFLVFPVNAEDLGDIVNDDNAKTQWELFSRKNPNDL